MPSLLHLVPKPSPQPDDSVAREQALDIQQSWIVEAPAGSGKTGLLIQRFLKLLAADNVQDPAQVLAITFTRKATVEMRDRVLGQLEAAQAGTLPRNDFDRLTLPLAQAVLEKDRRENWRLLDSPHRLSIRTIDSVCVDIARALPILSGAAGALTPTEDSAPLHAEAARRTLMLLGGDDPVLSAALQAVLLHRDANLADVEHLIADMLQVRDQWGELIPLSAEELSEEYLDGTVLPKLDKALDQAICRGLTRISNALPPNFLRSLCDLASDMGHAEGYNGNPSPLAVCAGRYSLPEEKAEHLDHWRALLGLLVTASTKTFRKGFNVNHLGFKISAAHKETLKALIAEVGDDPELCKLLCSINALPPMHYPAEQWPVAKALFRILSRALVELQLVFAAQTQCDFAEFGLLARAALRNTSALGELAAATGQNLQHLLVDEMQDTSTSQYELLQLLTQHWDGRSQTVFLVGDPKQSIYLFRQARVERFINTMRSSALGDLPLGTLRLTANFRSQSILVQNFNQDFSILFPPVDSLEHTSEVTYTPATARRPATEHHARQWHPAPVPYSSESDTRTQQTALRRRQAAAEIRDLAATWLGRPSPVPPKLAVLVRNRSHLLEVVAAFKQAPAVPYRAVQIEPLRERQEILDLLSLTRALLHPADRTAWLAVLRTPWCGLTLADLHLLSGADDPAFARTSILQLISTRGELLSEDGIARLQPAWQILSSALAQRGMLPLSQQVERTWRSFSAYTFHTEEELANIDQYLSLLDQLEAPGGTLDLTLLDGRLGKLYAAPAVHPGAVDLMTMHGAKGLEWDAVFVPALERIGASNRSRLLSWLEVDGTPDLDDGTVAHGILAPIQSKGTASQQLNTWMRSIESAREAAERKRLFYVACTRAREELHLFASPTTKQDGSLSIPPASLLASAWPAAEAHFQSPAAQLFTLPAQPQVLESLAAEAAAPQPRTILRIPLPRVELTPPVPEPTQPHALFDRPEGSFAARAFGNTVHAFLDQLAARIALGETPAALTAELPSWSLRIGQFLRASGLPPATIDRFTPRVLTALRTTLSDPDGRWLLTAHQNAATESALITWQDTRTSIRMDRSFTAGETPGTTATTHQWIIDYKTADLGGRDESIFLTEEKQKYAPQLEAYAAAFPTTTPIRVALYYPMLPKLVWWTPQS